MAISLTSVGTAYTQNFDTLSSAAGSTTNPLTIPGWTLFEEGGAARDNDQYAVDTGADATPDIYSYGSAGASDRALGMMRGANFDPKIGAFFVNNTGKTITALDISYIGEFWRSAGNDRIDFQFSLNATSLVTGTWTDVNALDYQSGNAANNGALDGNAAANRKALSTTITDLIIADGAGFAIRWTDFNEPGQHSGLAVDDFSLAAGSNFSPVIGGAGNTVDYTELGAPVVLDSGITVSDVDNTHLVSATVRIRPDNFASGGDVLAANVTGTNIAANYNAATKTLFLSGSDTLANYQQVLRTVTFASTSDDPDHLGGNPTRTIEWQVNDGAGLVGALFNAATGVAMHFPRVVAMADLNRDGALDLVATGFNTQNVKDGGWLSVQFGDGNGGFGTTASLWSMGWRPGSFAVADFNRDGKLDVAASNAAPGNNSAGTISVRLGDGNGGFGALTTFQAGSQPVDIEVGDVNGDGALDLVVGNANTSTVTMLLGDGDGGFGQPNIFDTGAQPSVEIGDLDGDGVLDLVIANPASNAVSVLLGHGNGGFDPATNYAAGANPFVHEIVDLNGDGTLDLVTTNDSSTVSVMWGDGNGGFGTPSVIATGAARATSVATADLNGDGALDVVVSNDTDGILVVLGDGNGGFSVAGSFAAGNAPGTIRIPQSIAIGDLDGNGALDIAVGNLFAGNISVLFNNRSNLNPVQHTTVTIGVDDSILVGTANIDVFNGGAGIDTVSYANSTGPVAVSLPSQSGVGGYAAGDTLISIENLIGSRFNDQFLGTADANLFDGRAGADWMDGGAGIDTVTYANSNGAVAVSLPSQSGVGAHAAGDTLLNIENLIGSNFNDQFLGTSDTNLFDGGAGADYMDGGAGIDTVTYANSTGPVAVSLPSQSGVGGHAAGDTLLNIENLIGSAFGDQFLGTSGANLFDGRGGGDHMDGGSGIDTVTYASSNASVAVSLPSQSGVGGHAAGDTLLNIENLIGSAFDDQFLGTDGANQLDGGGGNDFLEGGAGADILDGGAGIDTVSYARSSVHVAVSLPSETGVGGDAAGDVLLNIENIIGTAFDDQFLGTSGANLFDGGAGPDWIDGGGGIDTVTYASSNASVAVSLASQSGVGGHAAGDTLLNIENLIGSAFGDQFLGDAGANQFTGGGGNDFFSFNGSFGSDVIWDFTAGAGAGDIIHLDDAQFADFAAVMNATVDDGFGNTAIYHAAGQISLIGVTKAQLNADDFQFV